jgi:2-keto-4-pentenoate hydratase/2-oxohepta-3-ene-1,7-dioic acid hydratase in catechol pathway
MKLANFAKEGRAQAGIVDKELIFDLQEAATERGLSNFTEPLTVDGILSNGFLQSLRLLKSQITSTKAGKPVQSVKLLSPVLAPEKILLVAINYRSHSKEQSISLPSTPYFFTKFRNTLIGPEDPIILPRVSKKVDWEGELAVIIGKTGKNIPRKDAIEYVAGYSISNDVSFRDYQFSTRGPDGKTNLGLDWVKGKGLDSSFPLGPWLVTKDEIPDPHNLEISLSVNGQMKQRSNTAEMVIKIDALIEFASAGMTLKPGDIISTGTPEGVAAHTGQPFLKDSDIVEGKVEGIGTLRNPVKAE